MWIETIVKKKRCSEEHRKRVYVCRKSKDVREEMMV